MLKTTALISCLLLAAGCSGDKEGGCSGGIKLDVVKLPAWYEVGNAGTLTFEAGKKPIFTPTVGASDVEKFQKLFDEEMTGDGSVNIRFETVDGPVRHFCGAEFSVGQPEYPDAVVTYFKYERGMFGIEKLDKAPEPEPPAEKPAE